MKSLKKPRVMEKRPIKPLKYYHLDDEVFVFAGFRLNNESLVHKIIFSSGIPLLLIEEPNSLAENLFQNKQYPKHFWLRVVQLCVDIQSKMT